MIFALLYSNTVLMVVSLDYELFKTVFSEGDLRPTAFVSLNNRVFTFLEGLLPCDRRLFHSFKILLAE